MLLLSRRPRQAGFATKREARRWFVAHVAHRLHSRAPSGELSFDAFCDLFLDRHGATVAERTRQTLEERLAPARDHFGDWPLRELERGADDVAAWRAGLAERNRYRLLGALRQALAAAQRWGYISTNPAVAAGRNPQPRLEELHPFSRTEVDALAVELGPLFGPVVVFAAETGLRTNEWVALERRDVDRPGRACLTALDALPARLDTPLQFPAAQGGHIGLDTWRTRYWYPALEAAGINKRGPYHLRHSFATECLAAGVSTFELSRLMGCSVAMIDRTYGHLARDSEASIRARLDARAGQANAKADIN